jgi:hypothetical protein
MKKKKTPSLSSAHVPKEPEAAPNAPVLASVGTWEPIEPGPHLAAAAATEPLDKMVLEIRWAGGEARMQGLVDNGKTVAFGSMPVGPAGLRASWDSPEAGSHFLQFAVVFEGTRTDLVATATMDGAGGFDEPVKRKSADAIWLANGDVVPEGGE